MNGNRNTVLIIIAIVVILFLFNSDFFARKALIEVCINTEPSGFNEYAAYYNPHLNNLSFVNASVSDKDTLERHTYLQYRVHNDYYNGTFYVVIPDIECDDYMDFLYNRATNNPLPRNWTHWRGKDILLYTEINHTYWCNKDNNILLYSYKSRHVFNDYMDEFVTCMFVDENKQPCENSGGTWNVSTCICPENEKFVNLSGCEVDYKKLCIDSGGNWSNSNCTCPNGYKYENSKCVSKSSSVTTTTTVLSTTTTTLKKGFEFTIGDWVIKMNALSLTILILSIGGGIYYLYFFKKGPRLGKRSKRGKKRRK